MAANGSTGWSIRNIMKLPDIRQKLFNTLLILIVVRLGAQIPVPGVSRDVFASWFESQSSGAADLFDMMTGGSFSQMSIFALSITPYITASIIMQLMTIIIPSLEELQKDQDGREKMREYTFYLSVALCALQAAAMGIGFYRSGSLQTHSLFACITVIIALVTGGIVLVFLGGVITRHGIGNGISMILLFNIISRLPQDIGTLYDTFMKGSPPKIPTRIHEGQQYRKERTGICRDLRDHRVHGCLCRCSAGCLCKDPGSELFQGTWTQAGGQLR